MNSSSPPSSRALYLRLMGYVRPYWRVFAVSVATMALAAATEPVLPALMKPLLDVTLVARNHTNAYLVPLAIIGIFAVRGVLGFLSSYTLAWVSNKVVLDLRNALFARMLTLPTRYYDDNNSSVLVSKVTHEVAGVTSAATGVLTTLVKDSLTVVGLLGWLVYLNWRLTLITFIIAPGVAFVVKVFSKRMRRMSREGLRAQAEFMHVAQETINCHREVKIFGGQDYEVRRFERSNQKQRGYNMRQMVAASGTTPIVQIFMSVAVAVIISLALQQSAANELTVGDFVSFLTALLLLLAPIKHLTEVSAPLQRGLASAESVFELLDERPEQDTGSRILPRARGRIRYEGVSFAYPGAGREALDEVSVSIEPGETIALVGPSGGGKTTFVNLLPRFYNVTGGRILIDGIDTREITLTSLRANVALVSQDVTLFNDTVAANIAYGRAGGASRAELEAAARAAHALDFIGEMPEGLDTLIGEDGVRLSGGQRQRLAIARALLKDAPILLLDEATSALDSESERHVQAALVELMRGRTTIVIAHRLSTIEHAHRIVVLQRGRIVETGNHAELLARNGVYARLYRIQFALEQDETPA
ncbi:MAG TPA: lipid A export permease/ATP-binding protein MsbA [Burkholderiales bacterium]|nr:lipid A export permease/ATP-binding protein MsbA [Burkholderiales bacterium]